MALLIQEVSKAARRAFSGSLKEPLFQEKLNELVKLMNQVRGRDLNFNPALTERSKNNNAPVTYIHIFEDEVYSMGIFVLKENSRIPLHDHPGMFGIIKVIHGTLSLESFDEVPVSSEQPTSSASTTATSFNNEFKKFLRDYDRTPKPFLEVPKKKASVNDDCCVLSPTKGNLHEVRPDGGPAAFLDILAPPYDTDSDRRCNYYEITKGHSPPRPLSQPEESSQKISWLVQIQQPPDFWCDESDYNGPEIPSH
ncbi:2-aminoethanethiol dioxygenase-like [Octopus vulgaris]|uniref:2-aminoethanethiol dioxygenase-like n=2 Tax=Octopus TaxID=6643 RepID=A0AA36EYX8_OCTVU|nr:2-aminoethanethiol dioxygenase-like [Octopus sinensis]CAI9717245.1 2-aminoethanethiol dioxygenase-like [Octopus vulgaris]